MSIKIGATLVAAAMVASATPASAQLGFEANGARADGQWGGELGVGYAVPILPGLRITPAAGVLIYAGDNDRFYEDDNGGSSRCRDSTNGQYAKSEKCDNTKLKPYGRIEATYSIPASFSFGLGARISDEVRPYGTVAFPLAPKLRLKGNAGPHYYAAGVTFGF